MTSSPARGIADRGALTNPHLPEGSASAVSAPHASEVFLSDNGGGGLSGSLLLSQQQQQEKEEQDHHHIEHHHQQGASVMAPPKIGNRFSSEALKILRTWFASHEHDPYPTNDEIEKLQSQTGLNQRQVTNWFANARRRSKFYHSRPSSPFLRDGDDHHSSSSAGQTPVDTPKRRAATPAPFEHMNPLQRWENSPPEHEPATAHAISRAMAALTEQPRGRSSRPRRTNSSSAVSASSSVSSRGSGSCSSAHSYNSLASLERVFKRHGRRKRKLASNRLEVGAQTTLIQAENMYQCTFCTETFKTKYDWQRHEKSLHLSLENWVCSPEGPTANRQDDGKLVCVFCGSENPDLAHLNGHNQSACLERPLEERTFHRKDHLQQHLKLVHHSTFMKWPMDQWKVVGREIGSRCGFCGILLSTWAERVDHLGDHFKRGKTMADWKGDWGFDTDVLNRIDNAMPPYLIHYERNSPLPFAATKGPADTPTSGYELIKLEIEYYMRNHFNVNGYLPQDSEIQFEGCSVILGAEAISSTPASSAPSWFSDIFMSSTEIANRARLRPTKELSESRLSRLQVNGKGNIFENCELESSLRQFMEVQAFLGHTVTDSELQQEACNTLHRIEESSPNVSERFVEFMIRLIWASTGWLIPLRQRSPESLTNMPYEGLSISGGIQPTSMDNLMPFSYDLPWDQQPTLTGSGVDFLPLDGNEMAVETPDDHGFISDSAKLPPSIRNGDNRNARSLGFNPRPATNFSGFAEDPVSPVIFQRPAPPRFDQDNRRIRSGTPFFLNDNNSYRRLKRELSRFVLTTMSRNNPNSHIPTDDELKYQARWILYDDDDPWNQTPVDNAEWLLEFKRDVGLISGTDRDAARLPTAVPEIVIRELE
ncbi:hypothetical protein V2G26_012424 [Clonostachys chloroleuca]